ncbi:hypothetical protein ACF0H5_016206 [Mactra antiquata]
MPLGAIPFPFGTCRICKDRATGIHYGVATCEGCKGFFKRSITRGDKYKCFFGGECDLNPKNRNRCKSCRFQRCLDVGMSVESVRMGRIPKVDKEKALEAFQQSGSDYSKLELEVEAIGPGSYDFKIVSSNGTGTEGRKSEKPSEPNLHEEFTGTELDLSKGDPVKTTSGDNVCNTEGHFLEQDHSTYPTVLSNSSALNGSSNTKYDRSMPTQFSESSQTKINGTTHLKFTATSPTNSDGSLPRKINETPSTFNGSSPTKFSGTTPTKYSGTIPYTGEPNWNKGGQALPQDANRFTHHKSNKNCSATITSSSLTPIDYSKFDKGPKDLKSGWCQNSNSHLSNAFKSPQKRYSADTAMNSQCFVKKQGVDYNNYVDELTARNDFFSNSSAKSFHRNSSYWPADNQDFSVTGSNEMHQEISTCSMMNEPVCIPQNRLDQSSNDGCNSNVFNNHSQDLGIELSHQNNTPNKESVDLKPFSAYPKPHYGNMPSDIGNYMNFNKSSTDNREHLNMDMHMTTPPHSQYNDIPTAQPWPYNHQMPSNQLHTANTVPRNNTSGSFRQQEADRNIFSPCMSQISDTESHSIENARCPTPVGSTISGSSSGSKSNYSPSIIHLLIDEVLKSADLDSVKERLVSKSKTQNVDKTSMLRVLQLLEQSNQSKKGVNALDTYCSEARISTLPESREDCLKRFLIDINAVTSDHSVDYQVDLSKDLVLDKSFENLDVEHNVGTDMCTEPSAVTLPQESMVTNNKQSTSQSHSDNMVATDILNKAYDECNNDFIMSDQVTSSENNVDKTKDNENEIKATLTCMNLAQKILNRFKSEHREKIKLYMDGQLHLKVLTDSEEDIKEVYSKLIEGIPGLNDRILGFCNHVPDFTTLCSEDRDKLLKRSYYDLWTLSYAEYFRNGRSYWILPSGEIYSAEAMRKILNDEMVDTIFQFADKFNALNVTDLEMGLLGGISLTTIDGLELADPDTVTSIHKKLLDALAFEIKQNHNGHYAHILKEFFSLEPLMAAVNRLQREIIANFSTKKLEK